MLLVTYQKWKTASGQYYTFMELKLNKISNDDVQSSELRHFIWITFTNIHLLLSHTYTLLSMQKDEKKNIENFPIYRIIILLWKTL